MKKKDFIALKEKQISDLAKMITEKKHEVAVFYASFRAGKEKNGAKIKNLKREIARISSIIREKQILDQSDQSKKEEEKK